MEMKDVEAKLKLFQDQLSAQKTQAEAIRKDFTLQLDTAKRDADSWKATAQKREQEIAQFKELAEKEKANSEKLAKESRKREISEFVDSAKKAGKIVPAQEEIVTKLMESLTSEDEVAKFKEKDGSTKNHTQFSLFKAFINSLNKRKEFSELTETPAGMSYTSPDNFSEEDDSMNELPKHFTEYAERSRTKGTSVTFEGANIAAKAEEYITSMKAKGITVGYADALVAVSPKNAR